MNYREAIKYILSFTDYEKLPPSSYSAADFDLRRVEDLLHRLGDPHLGPRTVHIAGTGLTAHLYSGNSFNTYVGTRTDAQVYQSNGSGSFDTRLPTDNFSVYWTGNITVDQTENVTFYLSSDDGSRLYDEFGHAMAALRFHAVAGAPSFQGVHDVGRLVGSRKHPSAAFHHRGAAVIRQQPDEVAGKKRRECMLEKPAIRVDMVEKIGRRGGVGDIASALAGDEYLLSY